MTIPTLIVGGYLGAGKTTLINNFLRDPKGLRATVLVNDFGSINIDADLIENTEGGTIALTNGCACCSIGDDLLEAANSAAAAAPDLVIVEASGVAQPGRIALLLLGAAALSPARVLTVIDTSQARRNSGDKFISGLFRTQIVQAQLITCNRAEDPEKAGFWDGVLAEHAPDTPLVTDILSALEHPLPVRAGEVNPATIDPSFRSRLVQVPEGLSEQALEHWLESLPNGVHRAKGLVIITDAAGQARRMRLSLTRGGWELTPAPGEATESAGRIVLIGPGELNGIPTPR